MHPRVVLVRVYGDAEGGEPVDIESFCREQHPRIVGILTLYCGDQGVAEELAQEALARAWARWGRVSRLDNPAAWLYRVSINLANSWLRRQAAERRARSRVDDSESRLSETGADVDVRAAITALSRRQRMVIVLHYFLDMSFPEIAELMDAPLPTVKSLAQRARARLRSELDAAPEEVANVT